MIELNELTQALETRVNAHNEALRAALRALQEEVADREAAEAALRQSQKMEAVGQLTGGIAHDFNNLLTAIIGSLDLMQRRLAQGRHADVERLAAIATTSANRAAALTHRLLAFSRKQPGDRKVVEATKLVASMEDLLRRTLSESISLELEMPAGVWRTHVDASQLESAILNLAINARDAMPHGGRLKVAVSNLVVQPGDATWWGAEAGQYVSVAVSDTGEGMSPEIAEHVFEPFFTTKPPGHGTGLGLPMIYSFANQSGGAVKIDSAAGEGATVTILLPRYSGEVPDAAEDAVRRAGSRDGEGRVVLVVEDEQPVRALVMEVLQEHGYRGVSATDGIAGLEILQSDAHLDLLITDVGLPGLGGPRMVEEARGRRPDLPVLFITAYASEHDLHPAIDGANVALLAKPFTVDNLVSHIRARLAGASPKTPPRKGPSS